MFIAGMSSVTEPPINDLWTVPGEAAMLAQWQKEDSDLFNSHEDSMEYYFRQQIADFLGAVAEGREPLVTGEDGRKTVEIFTAIYRSQKSGKPIKFPLAPDASDLDYETYASMPMH